MAWLLDANVLIALSDEAHAHHRVAGLWLAEHPQVATCPITEGALTRYLVRQGQAAAIAQLILADLATRPGHEFWPDALPFAQVDLGQVIGHRQVTDAYLVSLVRRHGPDARLATLDEALARTYPDVSVLVGRA